MRDFPNLETQDPPSNKSIRLKIEKLVYGGYGLGHWKDKAVLTRYSAPNELAEVSVLEEKKDYIEAQVERVIISSNVRREAPCSHYGVCGGCQIQHIEYDAQVEAKEEILLETLQRIGKIKEVNLLDSVYSGQEFGYRIRVQFKVKDGRVGFFKWGSKEVVDVESCPLAHPKINELLPHIKECAKYIRELQEIHVSYSPSEDTYLVKFVSPTEIDKGFLTNLKEDCLPESVVGIGDYSRLRNLLNRRYWIGKDYLFMKVGRWTFRVSADAFFQVNHTLWERFIEAVTEKVSFKKAVDLYCGVGFFTLPLSEKGNFIEGSDIGVSAINDAQYNAKVNGRDNVVFVKSDAYRHLKSRAGEVLDLVVLDPPRSGLENNEIDLLVKNKPERIIYISCNPSTLARDLKVLLKEGYRLEGVRLVDMFPQTYHIESISYLTVDKP